MNTKKILIAILVCLLSFILFSFAVKVNATTISEDGKYSLFLTANEDDGCFDGEYAKLVRFNIKEGETTEDGKFSIDSTRCLGACGIAPVFTVNGEVYGRATVKKLDEVLDELMTK